ncbi:GNAT family N-acetyltransferase [Herbidospora yilanensis]|uniref:GNAT family N-acetyltransferase n=1 Tax=Herbidospora yilanensis TaxID=354426 RepID=UPI000A40B435|nr:GNAT family N-acetyltransferase [Herbidospora yilanensis]
MKLRDALTWDADTAEALVDRLVTPPDGRVWTSFAKQDGVVFASMSQGGDIGHVDLLAVDPAARRRGTGRALVLAAEEWARSHGAREMRFAGNPPCYAWPGIDVRYTPALCLADSLGYERYRAACNMTVDLVGDLRDLPGDFTISDDRAGVAEFVRENWNEAWAWEAVEAERCYHAEVGGEIVGFAAWGARPAWFGPMGTTPSARGLGVGTALLRRCLADMAAAGLPVAEIAWVGPIGFYAKAVGARVERVFWLYRKEFS